MGDALRYLLPNRKSLSEWYLPPARDLPEDSLLRAVGFNFRAVGPLNTAYASVQITTPFNAWAIVGVDSIGSALGFAMQLFHITKTGQRQLFSGPLPSVLVAGSGQLPLFIKETEIFDVGDAIRCEVKNFSTTTADNIWLALWGSDVKV